MLSLFDDENDDDNDEDLFAASSTSTTSKTTKPTTVNASVVVYCFLFIAHTEISENFSATLQLVNWPSFFGVIRG